jgi:hypothetical protein
MKQVTIAESMSNLRQKLDAIDHQEQPIQSPVSLLQEHMNTVENEYLSEGADRPFWNLIRGLGQQSALGKTIKVPKVKDPSGKVTAAHKTWDVPSPEDVAVNKTGQTLGKGIGAAGLVGSGWLAKDYFDALTGKVKTDNNEKPTNNEKPNKDEKTKPKPDGSIQALQHLLNLKYNAGIPEDGIWTPAFQSKFDELTAAKVEPVTPKVKPVTPKVEPVTPKVEPDPKKEKDQPDSNALRTDQIQGGLNNQPPKGQGAKPADQVTPPASQGTPPPAAPVTPPPAQTDVEEIRNLLQQLNSLKQEMEKDPETANELRNY